MEKKNQKTLALTGGGTMGHISPSLALLENFKKYYDKIIYIGSSNSMEEKIAKEHNLPFFSIKTIKFDRKHIFKNLKIPFVLLTAKRQAKKILISENVEKLFSKGGYVSLPVMLACQKLHLPNILHESDMSLGLANKICARKATKVFVSTPLAYNSLPKKIKRKAQVVGIPTKPEFCVSDKSKNVEKIKSQTNKKIMIITGGSQGATTINKIIQDNLEKLTSNYYIIHIVGKGKLNKNISHKDYSQLEFVPNIYDYFKASDIIISRAGATTIFEAIKSEANLICIPLPKSKSSRGDQVENAKYFKSLGLLEYINQEDFNIQTLLIAIGNIEKNQENRMKTIKNFNNSLKTNQEIAEIIAKTQ